MSFFINIAIALLKLFFGPFKATEFVKFRLFQRTSRIHAAVAKPIGLLRQKPDWNRLQTMVPSSLSIAE